MEAFEPARVLISPVCVAVILAMAATVDAGAQEGVLTGRVVSTVTSESGEPVPGVTVRLPDIPLARMSDEKGRFEFRGLPPGSHELQADLLGCSLGSRSVDLRAADTADVEFRVARPALRIPGIVATGVATDVPDAERSTSLDQWEPDPREGRSARSVADLIRGEFPSVRIRDPGQAGGEISIQLRGPTSIEGSQHPLVVIDGIITSGGFVDVNPSDVTRVRVMKGAAAAAEYGSRGEAGVIEITTSDVARDPAPEAGPLVIVDGEVSEQGLSPIDSDSIAHMETMTGVRAGVLFGSLAAEHGVLRVTTKRNSAGRDRAVLSGCVPPSR